MQRQAGARDVCHEGTWVIRVLFGNDNRSRRKGNGNVATCRRLQRDAGIAGSYRLDGRLCRCIQRCISNREVRSLGGFTVRRDGYESVVFSRGKSTEVRDIQRTVLVFAAVTHRVAANCVSLIEGNLAVLVFVEFLRRKNPNSHRSDAVVRDRNQTIGLRVGVLGAQSAYIDARVINVYLVLGGGGLRRKVGTRQRRISLIGENFLAIRDAISISICLSGVRPDLTLVLVSQAITIGVNQVHIVRCDRALKQLRRLAVVRSGVNNIRCTRDELVDTVNFNPRQSL